MEGNIWTWKIIDNKTIAANNSFSSEEIDIARFKATGDLSLQVEVSGSGKATFSYELSNNYADFVSPVGASYIISSFSASSGTNSDGKDIQPILLDMLAAFMRIKVTEVSGTGSVTVNAWIALQEA